MPATALANVRLWLRRTGHKDDTTATPGRRRMGGRWTERLHVCGRSGPLIYLSEKCLWRRYIAVSGQSSVDVNWHLEGTITGRVCCVNMLACLFEWTMLLMMMLTMILVMNIKMMTSAMSVMMTMSMLTMTSNMTAPIPSTVTMTVVRRHPLVATRYTGSSRVSLSRYKYLIIVVRYRLQSVHDRVAGDSSLRTPSHQSRMDDHGCRVARYTVSLTDIRSGGNRNKRSHACNVMINGGLREWYLIVADERRASQKCVIRPKYDYIIRTARLVASLSKLAVEDERDGVFGRKWANLSRRDLTESHMSPTPMAGSRFNQI